MARQSKHAPAKVQCSLRQREAAEWRAQKLTLDEIAEEMKISKPRVHQLLKAWDTNFKTENTERAAQLREEELEELRLLKKYWFPKAKVDLKGLQGFLKIQDQESALAGTKAAVVTKTEVSGSMTTVQTTFNGDDYTTEELEQLDALLSRQQPPSA